jgi:hypothetical protein
VCAVLPDDWPICKDFSIFHVISINLDGLYKRPKVIEGFAIIMVDIEVDWVNQAW